MKVGDRVMYTGPREVIKNKCGTVKLFPTDRGGKGYVRVDIDGFGTTDCLETNLAPIPLAPPEKK